MKGEIFNTYCLRNEMYETNQILNCGWRFKSEYYDHRSLVKEPIKRLKKNLKKKSRAWLGTFAMTGRNALPIELITSQLESRPLLVPNIPDGGNDMIFFFKVLFQPLRLFTRITCFIYYEEHIHFHTLSLFFFQRFVTQDITCSISMLSMCLLLY